LLLVDVVTAAVIDLFIVVTVCYSEFIFDILMKFMLELELFWTVLMEFVSILWIWSLEFLVSLCILIYSAGENIAIE